MGQGIVVKIWNVKASSNTRSASAQISDSINYIENPQKAGVSLKMAGVNQIGNELTYVTNDLKTVNGLYVGSRHISDISKATEEMMQVKAFFGKLDGRVATHGVISLDESESDERNAAKLMYLLSELMERIFPEHQVVYAVHTNTENLHIHFIINTVGLDGKKIHMDKKFMRNVFEPAVNELAQKYGFTPNEKWVRERAVDPMTFVQRKVFLRNCIDHAIEETDSFDAFVAYLRADGLTVNVGRQITVQTEEMAKAIRTGSLGENYGIEEIHKRLEEKYNPFQKGRAGDYYKEILPEQMLQIVPYRMKKYKDMTQEEKQEAIRLLKLKRNPWQENYRDNWQMEKMGNELSQITYVYKLVHYYSNGTDYVAGAMNEIVERRKEISKEKKTLYKLQKQYKPITDIYEELKKHMVRAYLYDALGKEEYEQDFLKYRELLKRLEVSYGKSVEEVADFVAETRNQILYLKGQEKELSKQYAAIKKYADDKSIEKISDEYSFFQAVGYSQALYDAKKYGIYASEYKFIHPLDKEDITIRVVTTPTVIDGKPGVETALAVIDKEGIVVREFSSKGMDEKSFNKILYEVQSEYGIKKCSVTKNKIQGNSRQI